MAKEFSRKFYHSKSWKSTRAAYFTSKRGLCERCLAQGKYNAGEIVHHKTELTPSNINDPNITLAHENLELVCRDCHYSYHPQFESQTKSRVAFDEYGNVVPVDYL